MANKLFANIFGSQNDVEEVGFNVNISSDDDDDNVDVKIIENSLHLDDFDKFESNEFVVDEECKPCGGDDNVPYMSQTFSSLDDAETFFRAYALKNGFSIKIKTTQKRVNSEIYARMYVCRHYGKTVASTDEPCESSIKVKRRRDVISRSDCKVRMYVRHRPKLNHWEVTSLELEHNHSMVTPSKVCLMERERNVTPTARNIITTLNKSGIAPSVVMNVFSHLGGGVGNVGFASQNVRNVLRDERRKTLDVNDAQSALDLLGRLNEESCGKFFIRIQLDDEQRLKSIVWVDPRCLMAYKNFGDVVAFDTTYRTNRYSMPFVPFTGVNHHYQSVIFGFALMRDENIAAFEWVLSNWLEGVGQKQPIAIITDQDQAMAKAIASTLPKSYHLLCSWHISNKFPEKLASFYSKYPNSFKVDFNNCIYRSVTEETFEDRWSELLQKYELQDHSWLLGMYELKRKWIPAYTKNIFAAGQTTTSRSEGMNAFFDGYVSPTTGMKEFIENSQKALDRQFMREKEEDYITSHRARALKMNTALELHASKVYTKEMFRQFQGQLTEVPKYSIVKDKSNSNDREKLYELYRPLTDEDKRNHYYVFLDKVSLDAVCSCKMFAHLGIPCRHLLAVLQKNNVLNIPENLLMRRWTINANRVDGMLPYDSVLEDANVEMSPSLRFSNLTMATMGFCQSGMASLERYNYAMGVISRELAIIEQMGLDDPSSRTTENESKSVNTSMPQTILDPVVSTTKGRKKVERFKSPVESIGDVKPLRKCAYCGASSNHDKRNCPVRIDDLSKRQIS